MLNTWRPVQVDQLGTSSSNDG